MNKHRLVALLGLFVLALAAFTGTAFAGGGNDNGGANGNSASAPGQQKQATPPAAPAAPAAKPAPAAKQASKPAPATKHASKQSSTSASSPATGGSNANGVKPSNTTKHDAYAKASSDQTKKYGNGKTAGQIATAAGYGDATLHGPGNSQPHKVLCGGHEVDVHALAHKGDKCGTAAPATQPAVTPVVTPQVSAASNCETTTTTETSQVLVGVNHKTGNGKFVLIHPSTKSAHYTGKHSDDVPVYQTVTKTIVTPTGANCSSTQSTQATATQSTASSSVTSTSSTATESASAGAVQTAQSTPATATPVAAGAVKGAVVTLKPKAKSKGGVLGATTRLGGTVASARLPFTGLPLWIFTAVAAVLIGAGIAVRRAADDRI